MRALGSRRPSWRAAAGVALAAAATVAGLYTLREPSPDAVAVVPGDGDPAAAPSPAPEQRRVRTQEGDLTLTTGTTQILGEDWVLRGNLTISGDAHLVVRDAVITFEQEHDAQYFVRVVEGGRLTLEDVTIHTGGKWMYWQYEGDAVIDFTRVDSWDEYIPWHSLDANASMHVRESLIGVNVVNGADLVATDSELFIELVLEAVTDELHLPVGPMADFDLTVVGDTGPLHIAATDSTFLEWGATLSYDNDVTFVGTTITIGMNAGTGTQGPDDPHVAVSGLRAGRYDDFDLTFDSNRVRLRDTVVTRWYPQAFGRSVVEIGDSDLADLQWNGDQARIVVRNSDLQMALARQDVVYEIHDSRIHGDVTVLDNGRIYLYDTEVGGEITELGNGQVHVEE